MQESAAETKMLHLEMTQKNTHKKEKIKNFLEEMTQVAINKGLNQRELLSLVLCYDILGLYVEN